MTDYWPHNENISKDLYEKRFWQRTDSKEALNVVGYGADSKYIPPITKPATLLQWWDKYVCTLKYDPFGALINYYLKMSINGGGDHEDKFLYNNAKAAGSQLYPSGVYKYYDLYSEEGVWEFVTSYFTYFLMY